MRGAGVLVALGAAMMLIKGLVLIATDNAAYAGQICRVMGASPRFARDAMAEHDLTGLGPGHAFTPTHFESKYQREGRVIRRYAFRRNDG